jgi:hypothetical protein
MTMMNSISRSTLMLCLLMLLVIGAPVSQAQNLSCGLKPIPNIGCRIGRCVDGTWEQICDSNPGLSCGIKPIPNVGCRIGRCVDGAWEQICDSNPGLSCGIKPVPKIGCRIGRCVDGAWEQVCKLVLPLEQQGRKLLQRGNANRIDGRFTE